MVINGASRSNVRFWARHLQETKENDRAEVVKIDGLAAENLLDALREMEAHAKGTSCKNFMWISDINPLGNERLTEEEWEQARAILEKRRGLTGQPYVVIEHEKEGRVHRHVVWSRIDTEHGRALPDGLDAKICHAAAREIERDLGLARTKSPLDKDRDGPRPKRAPKSYEMYRGMKSGIDPRDIQAEVTALFHQSDNGKAFQAALEQRGYLLARGDRRGFVILDSVGHDHSLARRLDGINTKELNAFMHDVDRAALPSVEQGKAKQQERTMAERQADLATVQHEIAWEESLAKSAIEREKAERRFVEPRERKMPGFRGGDWPIMPPQPEPTTTSPRLHFEDAARGTTRPEPAPVMPEKLRGPAAQIWTAYRHSDNAKAFAAALDEHGIALAVTTTEEAHYSHRNAAFAKEVGNVAPRYAESEIVAVSERGRVYQLTQRTTGEDRAKIAKFLKPLDRTPLQGIEATKETQKLRAAARSEQRNTEVQAFRDLLRDTRTAQRLEQAQKPGRAAPTRVNLKSPAALAKAPVRAAGGLFKAAGKFVDSLFELIDPVLTPAQKREQALHARDREADAAQKLDFAKYQAERELDRQQHHGREAERQQRQRERDDRDR